MPKIEFFEKINKGIYDKFPNNMTVNGDKKVAALKWVGEHISSPENRLIMGVTALATQVPIDYYNKDVDKETGKVSAARTGAKILAGTITGVSIRYGTIALVKQLAKGPEAGKKFKAIQKILTPSNIDIAKFQNEATKIIEKGYLNQYCNTIGTIFGLIVMAYTNFALDIPLTRYFTKIFLNKMDGANKNGSIDEKGGKK